MLELRSNEPEIMDDLECNGKVVEQTLKELDFINTWLGGNDITLNAVKKNLKKIRPKHRATPVVIADLGCGSGYILRKLSANARKNSIPARFIGIDANPFIVEYARNQARQFPDIEFLEMNVFNSDFRKKEFDIVNCTLFCHHFSNDELAGFLKNLYYQTRNCIIINDIHRHWFAYHSIKWLTYVFSSSPMVKYDARLSVKRSFKRKELEEILAKAGIKKYSIRWKWAFRYEIIIDTRKEIKIG